jgi:hypothetical protein
LIVEVREIHTRREKAFGYDILANDENVYFRTYEEYGAGPNHYFFIIDSSTVGDGDFLKLTFLSESGAAFSLGGLWVYDSFFESVAVNEQIPLKMPLYVHFSKLKTLDEMKSYENFNCFSPVGQHSFITYGNKSIEETRKKFHNELKPTQMQIYLYLM